jgi:hypothetical protein
LIDEIREAARYFEVEPAVGTADGDRLEALFSSELTKINCFTVPTVSS